MPCRSLLTVSLLSVRRSTSDSALHTSAMQPPHGAQNPPGATTPPGPRRGLSRCPRPLLSFLPDRRFFHFHSVEPMTGTESSLRVDGTMAWDPKLVSSLCSKFHSLSSAAAGLQTMSGELLLFRLQISSCASRKAWSRPLPCSDHKFPNKCHPKKTGLPLLRVV